MRLDMRLLPLARITYSPSGAPGAVFVYFAERSARDFNAPSGPRTVAIICGDTTPNAKPHPEPLLAAGLALSVDPSDCVYVGDAERDIIAGRAAGMKTLIASYGYLGADDTPEHWAADGAIHSLPELLDWLPETVARAVAAE